MATNPDTTNKGVGNTGEATAPARQSIMTASSLTWLLVTLTGAGFLAAIWLLPIPEFAVGVPTPWHVILWWAGVAMVMYLGERYWSVPLPARRDNPQTKVAESFLQPTQIIWTTVLIVFPLDYAIIVSASSITLLLLSELPGRRDRQVGAPKWVWFRGSIAQEVMPMLTFAAIYSATAGLDRGSWMWVGIVGVATLTASSMQAAILALCQIAQIREEGGARTAQDVLKEEVLADATMAVLTFGIVVIGVEAALQAPGLLIPWLAFAIGGLIMLKMVGEKRAGDNTLFELSALDGSLDLPGTLSRLLSVLYACEGAVTYGSQTHWICVNPQRPRNEVLPASPLDHEWMNALPDHVRGVELDASLLPNPRWRTGFTFPLKLDGKLRGTLTVGFCVDTAEASITSTELARALHADPPPLVGAYPLILKTATHLAHLVHPQDKDTNTNTLLLDMLRSMSTTMELTERQVADLPGGSESSPELVAAIETLKKTVRATTTVVSDDEQIAQLVRGEGLSIWDEPQETTVHTLVNNILSDRPTEVSGFVTLAAETPDTPIEVIPEGFDLALRPLIANAECHAYSLHSGSAVVSVEAGDNDATVSILVSDFGPGIAPGEERLIFQSGTRGSNGKPDGSGGGLFLARAAAEHLGGTVTLVDSHIGATFRLTLPRESAADSLW